jgi:hypothetical protein
MGFRNGSPFFIVLKVSRTHYTALFMGWSIVLIGSGLVPAQMCGNVVQRRTNRGETGRRLVADTIGFSWLQFYGVTGFLRV